MLKWYHLVLPAMNDEHWTLDLIDPLNVLKHVEKRPFHRYLYLDDTGEGTLQHDTSKLCVLSRCDPHGGSSAQTRTKHDNLVLWNLSHIDQVVDGGLNRVIDALFGALDLWFTYAVALVLVGTDIDLYTYIHIYTHTYIFHQYA